MTEGLVSVVVPTFNRAHCLGRTLDSVLSQTYTSLELIVVDDGSTDSTRELVETLSSTDRRVRYAYQQNAGVCAARNRGFALARGDHVALLDSDDAWMPWKIALQVACLAMRPDLGMCWTDMQAVDPSGQVVSPRYLREMYDAYRWFTTDDLFQSSQPLAEIAPKLAGVAGDARLYVGDLYSPMVMGNLVHTSTVLLRRERLERVGGFDETLRFSGEDYDFHLRTCREGPVGYIDLASIRYQRGMPDRLTRPEYSIHMARNFLRTIQPVIDNDRHRIRLPESMIRSVLAEAHGWIGEAALAIGQSEEARRHLARSLRFSLWQPRTAGQLLLSLLPPPLAAGLRAAQRRVRGALRLS